MGKVPERNTMFVDSGVKCPLCEKISHIVAKYKNIVICFMCDEIYRFDKYKDNRQERKGRCA